MDLSQLNLTEIPMGIPLTVQHLFLNHNELKWLPDLSALKNLQVLDVSGNQLEDLSSLKLPSSLLEFSCRSNKITSLPPQIVYVQRLDCCHNLITDIPDSTSLLTIECSYNKIKNMPTLPNATKIVCRHNKLKTISEYPRAKHIDCKANRITTIEPSPNVECLLCDDNNLNGIAPHRRLKMLVCTSNNEPFKVEHSPVLEEITCDNTKVLLNKNYLIKTILRSKGIQRIHLRSKTEG